MPAIDTDPENMWQELEASRRQMEKQMSELDGMIARYHGYYYDPSSTHVSGADVENPGYELMATMSSQLIAGNVQWLIDPARTDDPMVKMRAVALRFTMNRLCVQLGLKRHLRKMLVDSMFFSGITVMTRKAMRSIDPGPLNGPSYRPSIMRVPVKMFRRDARAMEWEDTAYRAFGVITSRQRVLGFAKEEGGWHKDEIEEMRIESNLDKLLPKEGQSLKRDDFILWSVWIPDEQVDESKTPEKGYWGTWHYYAQTSAEGGGKNAPLLEIRDPQPAFSPRSGPFFRFGQHYVPDHIEPLSVMVAIERIAKSLNATSGVIERAIGDYKRFLIYGMGDPSLGKKLKNVKHNGLLYSQGFESAKAQQFEVGGISAEMLAAYQWKQEQFWKRSGLTEAMMGKSSTGATATADTLAAGGANARLAGFRDMFYDDLLDLGRGLLDAIDSDDEFYMPLPPEASQVAGVKMLGLRGGRDEGQTYEDYDLNVAPLMSSYRSEQDIQMAAERDLQAWMQIGQALPSMPFLEWPEILRKRGQVLGDPGLQDRVNYPLADEIAGLMLMGQVQPQGFQGSQSASGPKSAKDSGQRPAERSATPQKPMAAAATTAAKPVKPGGTFGASSGNKARSSAKTNAKPGG